MSLPFLSYGSEPALESFTYKENFETNGLNAWASYPLWQDTAFDPNIRINTIVPGDPNLSLVQKVTPYAHVDNYAGAQKILDMYLIPGSSIKLRYFLKSYRKADFFKICVAAGDSGKVDYTIPDPLINEWVWITVSYEDMVRQNPKLKTGKIKVNAMAVLAKFPSADPAMPIYLGLDDVIFRGARKVPFRFSEPRMHELQEYSPKIPGRHYHRGEDLTIKGTWPVQADSVTLEIKPFTDKSKTVLKTLLQKAGSNWILKGQKLGFPEGLYLARLQALLNKKTVSETEFTVIIAPENIVSHPRLWFDPDEQKRIKSRLKLERFQKVAEEIHVKAIEAREKIPVDSVVFDLDQFPEDEPLIGNVFRSVYPWFNRITPWRDALYDNTLAYALLDSKEAGLYAKNLMLKLSSFPFWVHPWFQKRARHIYYPVANFGMDMALCYDLVYGLFTEKEQRTVRHAFMKNIILPAHNGYVEGNLVTSNTSNWVGHIAGGSLMCQAAIYSDDLTGLQQAEPYFTGALLKMFDFIEKAFGRDGSYGESYGYYNFTMSSLIKVLPALENVFGIDFSGKIHGSYREIIWTGPIETKTFFQFGDSSGSLRPLTHWAWLLPKYKDPLLGWFYNFMKTEETLMDVLYETARVPQKAPFDKNPNRLFRDIGTTVFKSGWKKDDFIFAMRTGAFYNHQHIDQGTFWLADKGESFIRERKGSTYYDDPIYQSHYTQPIAHSTILIDHNPQSQRTGDPLVFAKGFDDRAFVFHFLEGRNTAFLSGDIGRLYWGKVKGLRRNVLYLKPRTVLMLDTITPAEKDVDVTLLYQTARLDSIRAGNIFSSITLGKNILQIFHLAPEKITAEIQGTPHYIFTLQNEYPLIKEGMLTVTAETHGRPLVFANLLTTTTGEKANVDSTSGSGYISGVVNNRSFAFSTRPGRIFTAEGFKTDALTFTWDKTEIFAALCTQMENAGKTIIRSTAPITFEASSKKIKYYLAEQSQVSVGVPEQPIKVFLNGKEKNFNYDKKTHSIVLTLPSGEGILTFKP
ncbi:MAG: heparinase II/III family protein [Candidatus Aminicenantes bacterium]|nr:heparinase II/III family protein [Candidatus Aminicenantes bacterium]